MLVVATWVVNGTRCVMKRTAMDVSKGPTERHFEYHVEELPGRKLLVSSPPASNDLIDSTHDYGSWLRISGHD